MARKLDIHELLKQEAFKQTKECSSHFEKNKPCPYDIYGVSDQYIILDSFVKLRESNVRNGEFKWNFMIQGVTDYYQVGVKDTLENVVEVQMGRFSFPILEEVPYILNAVATTNSLGLVENNNNAVANTAPVLGIIDQYPPSVLIPAGAFVRPWIHNPYTQLPYNGNFTIQMEEVGLQSYSTIGGGRHHFEYTTEYSAPIANGNNPTMLVARPSNNTEWSSFIFTDPIKDIHGITLRFKNPDFPIHFLPDVYYNVRMVLTLALPTTIQFITSENHILNVGDRIFINGSNTGVLFFDNYINRIDGHVASNAPPTAVISGTPINTGNTFYTDPAIEVDLATVPPQPPPPAPAVTFQTVIERQSLTVYVAKRRLRIPTRLRKIVPRLTNYVQAV